MQMTNKRKRKRLTIVRRIKRLDKINSKQLIKLIKRKRVLVKVHLGQKVVTRSSKSKFSCNKLKVLLILNLWQYSSKRSKFRIRQHQCRKVKRCITAWPAQQQAKTKLIWQTKSSSSLSRKRSLRSAKLTTRRRKSKNSYRCKISSLRRRFNSIKISNKPKRNPLQLSKKTKTQSTKSNYSSQTLWMKFVNLKKKDWLKHLFWSSNKKIKVLMIWKKI